MKKVFSIILLFVMILCITTTVNAATYTNTKLEVVDETVCTINLGDMGIFEKKIVNFNADEKSVTLELNIKNIKEVDEEYKPVEIFLVVDNSYSTNSNRQTLIDSAKKLVEKLHELDPNVQIGVVSFSSLDASQGETEGTINDAELRLDLSTSTSDINNALDSILTDELGPRTNLDAGITLANQSFNTDTDADRFMVILTDAVPNTAVGGPTQTYSGEVTTKTRAKLKEIADSGVNIISSLVNLDDVTTEPSTGKTYKALAEEIFGTEEDPFVGNLFYINEADIEDHITNTVYEIIKPTKVDNTIQNIVIKDYFPQEIIDNFDFEYVASPNIGNVSQEINDEDNSITWEIELLEEGETATLSYKLTLRDNYNVEILDKVIPTNNEVDIDYTHNGEDETVFSEDSPKVKVTADEEPAPENNVDNTVANTPIPQTGNNTFSIIAFVVIIALAFGISRLYLLKKYNNK